MNADVVVTVHGRDSADLGRKIEAIDALARTPQETPPGPVEPPVTPPVEPPVLQQPYFDIGDASGKAGDVVELSVEGGCRFMMNGFHIGGGCGYLPDVERSGYGKFEAVGVKLGAYLHDYLKSHGAITEDDQGNETDHYFSIFQMINWETHKALPEEWWEYAVGFFSIGQERIIPDTQIPSGTEIFTLQIKILPNTLPGEYTVTCLDEHYFTNARPRRRDFMYTGAPPGGHTKLDLKGGKITVTA